LRARRGLRPAAFGIVTLGTLALASLARLACPGGGSPATSGYAPMGASDDTLRVRLADTRGVAHRGHATLGSMIQGYLSPRGLPPLPGVLLVTDTGLVFRSTDGRYGAVLPVIGPLRESSQGRWRAAAVSLAYVDQRLGRPAYLFRVDGGVFETDVPGPLAELARHPAWLDSLGSREWRAERALVNEADRAAARGVVETIVNGSYADSLYAVFGRPARPAGLVGEGGRAAGRLGEYITTRDSLALDPARMTSVAQLRHTLAHELAHRWQSRSGAQLAVLWRGVEPIRDPKRYGYGNRREHQAEAAAFAVHFLLATSAAHDLSAQAVALDHYDLLVPGTRTMARYFAMQPVFRQHPLRTFLTMGQRT
jgi:hypothetical protein